MNSMTAASLLHSGYHKVDRLPLLYPLSIKPCASKGSKSQDRWIQMETSATVNQKTWPLLVFQATENILSNFQQLELDWRSCLAGCTSCKLAEVNST